MIGQNLLSRLGWLLSRSVVPTVCKATALERSDVEGFYITWGQERSDVGDVYITWRQLPSHLYYMFITYGAATEPSGSLSM